MALKNVSIDISCKKIAALMIDEKKAMKEYRDLSKTNPMFKDKFVEMSAEEGKHYGYLNIMAREKKCNTQAWFQKKFKL